MRKLATVLGIALIFVGIGAFVFWARSSYYAVAQIDLPDGGSIKMLKASVRSTPDCAEFNKAFVEAALKNCPTCTAGPQLCVRLPEPAWVAMREGLPVPESNYVWVEGGGAILIEAEPEKARKLCETMPSQIPGAHCVKAP